MASLVSRIANRARLIVDQTREAAAQDGLRGGARYLREFAYWNFYPSVRRWNRQLTVERARDLEYDRVHGIETAGETKLADSGISATDAARGNSVYRPVWEGLFRESMAALPIDPREYTFVDYGSGKGKVLFLASNLPFKAIRGVEYAPALHQAAEGNIARFASATRQCSDLRSVCADATTYEPPVGPLVCFFFNPFDEATWKRVLANLERVRRSDRSPLYVVAVNTRDIRENLGAFRDATFLRESMRRSKFVLYEAGS